MNAPALEHLHRDELTQVADELARWATKNITDALELDDAQVARGVGQILRGVSLAVTAERRHRAQPAAPCRHELVNTDAPALEHYEHRRATRAHPPRPGAVASTPRTPHGPPASCREQGLHARVHDESEERGP